jgi:hypothetical protein
VNELLSYVFSPLREGGISLYRGSRKGLPPILLVAAEETSLGYVERPQREYALKAELDSEWAARPVALTRHNGRMTLMLEDPGGTPLDRWLGRPLDVSYFLRIACPLARTLRHRSWLPALAYMAPVVMNGIEAMQSVMNRPLQLTIRSCQDENQQVRVSLTDCGVGIFFEDADRLFVPFTIKSIGMDMGLSICRSMVEAHGGLLSASGNEGPGATFQFALPVNADTASSLRS